MSLLMDELNRTLIAIAKIQADLNAAQKTIADILDPVRRRGPVPGLPEGGESSPDSPRGEADHRRAGLDMSDVPGAPGWTD
jgi:hypothetical protein